MKIEILRTKLNLQDFNWGLISLIHTAGANPLQEKVVTPEPGLQDDYMVNAGLNFLSIISLSLENGLKRMKGKKNPTLGVK